MREAAGSKRTDVPARRPILIVALLLGLASLAFSLGSLGARRSAAPTTIATRLRSKGLSSAVKPRARPREDAPRAIRYRD